MPQHALLSVRTMSVYNPEDASRSGSITSCLVPSRRSLGRKNHEQPEKAQERQQKPLRTVPSVQVSVAAPAKKVMLRHIAANTISGSLRRLLQPDWRVHG